MDPKASFFFASKQWYNTSSGENYGGGFFIVLVLSNGVMYNGTRVKIITIHIT